MFLVFLKVRGFMRKTSLSACHEQATTPEARCLSFHFIFPNHVVKELDGELDSTICLEPQGTELEFEPASARFLGRVVLPLAALGPDHSSWMSSGRTAAWSPQTVPESWLSQEENRMCLESETRLFQKVAGATP